MTVEHQASASTVTTYNLYAKSVRFVNDASGLEKTLRFLQSFAQIVAALSFDTIHATPWLTARRQLALGRRYLRFFKFIDAFSLAYTSFESENGLVMMLKIGKWSCLGMYLGLESTTILSAMGVYNTTWAPKVFHEAMKFWFYSLVFSIVLGLVQLYNLSFITELTPKVMFKVKHDQPPHPSQPKAKTKTKPSTVEKAASQVLKEPIEGSQSAGTTVDSEEEEAVSLQKQIIIRKIATDIFDLFIPGSTTGWIETSSLIVGIASAVSTVLGGVDVWDRV